MGAMNMVAPPPLSSSWAEVHAPNTSLALTEKQSITLSPWFLSYLDIHPVCEYRVLISDIWPSFQSPNYIAFCSIDPCFSSWRFSPGFCSFARSLIGDSSSNCAVVHGLWQHWAESWHLDSLHSVSFPALMLGNSATLRHTCSSCDPGDPETMLSHLGFHTFHHLRIFKPGTLQHSRLLKVPFCALSLMILFSNLFKQALSPSWFIFWYINLDSHLCTSYIAKVITFLFQNCSNSFLSSLIDFAGV